MNKAVFLDRDGVINSDVGLYYIYKVSDFQINTDIFQSLRLLQQAGFLLFIISNQGGISKGIYGKEAVDKVHQYLLQQLDNQGIKITEIYYCPHHSDYENCICRKPDSQLIEKAIAKYQIDPQKSYFIGDSMRDIQAAEKLDIQAFKTEANQSIFAFVEQIIR